MTDEHLTADGEDVLTLQQLVRARMDERGWSYGDLERLSDHRLSKGRWQQMATGVRQTNFPLPANVQIMADVLEVDVTTILLAAGQSLGLDARRRGSAFAQLLPAGVDELPEQMREGLLTIIRAAVAQATAANGEDRDESTGDVSVRWRKAKPATRGNTSVRSADTLG